MSTTRDKADCISCKRNNDADDMVQCDGCQKWQHFSCAGVDSGVTETSFECFVCSKLNATVRNQSTVEKQCCSIVPAGTQTQARIPEVDRQSENQRSVASTKRSKRMLKLDMLRLNEQKKLDDEYLRKKFEILALEEEEDEEEDLEDERSLTEERVAEWINNTKPTAVEGAKPEEDKKLSPAVEEVVSLDQRQIAARQVLAKELPVFSGNPEEWPLFISSYENTTKLCGFSHEENLWRLQRALKGGALRAVGSRLMLPSTVPEIISELRMLYGQPAYIVQTMLKKIRAEPSPKVERLDTIIQYALSVRSLQCTIEASGLTNHLSDPTLLQELVDKLPASIKLNWALYNGKQEHDLTKFSKWLYGMAEAASTVTTYTAPDGRNERRQAPLHTHSEDRTTSRRIQQNQTRGGCYLCEHNHKLSDCQHFRQLTVYQRWEMLKSKGVCEGCLGHPKRFRCRAVRVCGINGCEYQHHPLLHNYQEALYQSTPIVDGNHHTHQQSNVTNTLFSIVPVVLYGNGRSFETFAFLDNGSSLTLVEESVANNLGLKGVNKPLCLKWTSDTTRLEEESKIVPLEISARSEGVQQTKYWLRDVRTVKRLALPVQSVDQEEINIKYSHFNGVPLQSYNKAQCGILIGINNQRLLLPQRIREGGWNDPVAIKTRLGWCVSGSNVKDAKVNGVYHAYDACECNKDLHEMVRQHFILEEHGIDKQHVESAEEMRAKDILRTTVKRQGNSFSTGLLWRYEDVVLPDSFSMALKRLRCMEKKMSGDTSLRDIINGQIQDLVVKGYARKLKEREIEKVNARTWYLPTFIVRNHNKPEKLRLVWDAAASTQGVSLNSMLLKGPDELRVLTEVLYGFRTRRIAIAGDIEEMFHQVGVREEDQDSQRFLWRDGDSNRVPDVYVMKVLTFGATCSPSIAQYVKNTNAREFAHIFPRATEAIVQHHYVDDLLDSVDTIEEAIRLAEEVKYIHSMAGFNIRNWLSNSKEVLQALNQPESKGKIFEGHSEEAKSTAKVLGLWWNTSDDIFTFSLKFTKAQEDILKGHRMPTKRELLRVLMSIYDPLGFLSFYLVKLKILLQEVWRSTIGWDETISLNLQSGWESWRVLLPRVEEVRVQRCYLHEDFNIEAKVQLHVFVDASEDAMAAVAYFRFENGNSVDCVIIGAKSKVAPLKPLSIPRLELQAALIGSRLASAIEKSHTLKIERRFLWTDSRNVLCWLQSDARRYKPFVMFRVGEISELTLQEEWRWIPTKLNVADLATKWTRTPTFDQDTRWFKGPEFLYDEEAKWPILVDREVTTQNEEVRPQFLLMTDEHEADPIIEVTRFSTWRRLLRSMAWVFRFTHNVKAGGSKLSSETLSSEELHLAQTYLLQMAQKDKFADELILLKNNKTLPKGSPLVKCSPYLGEDGLLRLKGRIDGAWCIEENTKRPILMPKDHYLTFLLVYDYHTRFHHRCQETVINEMRQKFWIPTLRRLVRSVRTRCQQCRNDRAVPANPEMAPLPEARLSAYVRPFTFTGVDYFGPILIKSGRKMEKRWGVLFTCLTIRAIHIEVAHSLTSDSCIMCIRNFISRRGTPREIYSDNGTNLKGAEKELRQAFHEMDKEVIQSTFTSAETRWFFNPPAAPHMGGCWERLIGTVKGVLKEITKNQRLEEESLRSTLIEIEGIVNSRPLTYVAIEAGDAEALTPNHFLLGSSSGSKPPGAFNDKDLLRKSWRVVQQLSNMFWRRWIREYLPTLTRRTKWFQQVKNVAVGDVVIIVDENLPRNTWPKGIIVNTITAKDGQIRRATVRTAGGTYDRPVVKLAVLDVGKPDEGEAAVEASQAAAPPGGRNVADERNACADD